MMRNSPASNLRRTRRMRARRAAGATVRGCTISGCPYGHYARGYCERHWKKQRSLWSARQRSEAPDA